LLKLTNVTEQHVLKAGVVRMAEMLVGEQDMSIMELPKNVDGSPKVLQSASFLRRLLSNVVELKSCMETDVSAAQCDVRHLSPEQLLAIRVRTLNFATESQSHGARNSFLETVDRHLFVRLARRCLQRAPQLPERPEPLHALGLRITLTLGAHVLLVQGCGAASRSCSTGSLAAAANVPAIPICWALRLNPEEWPERCRAAVFHAGELWVEALPGVPEFATSASGGPLAVVCDRTKGLGNDRMLHWEIAVLDSSTEDVLAELERDPQVQDGKELRDELNAAFTKRVLRTL